MYFLFMLYFQFWVEFFQMEFCCLYLFLYSDAIFWFSRMILKEKNNPKKILMDGVLDVNHKQENMPSANGKACPRSHSLSGSRLTIRCVWGCWDLSPMHHVGLSGCEGHVSSRAQKAVLTLPISRKCCVPSLPKQGCLRFPFPFREPATKTWLRWSSSRKSSRRSHRSRERWSTAWQPSLPT